MKKMKHTIALLLACIFITTSCIEDNTITNFKDLNTVEISDIELKYSVPLLDTLEIEPTITTSADDDSNLSYLWYIYRPSEEGKDTIGFEKNLKAAMLPKFVTAGLTYNLGYKVIDNTTGIYYRKETAVEITTLYSKGTILLCRENGATELNFLQADSERTLLENIFSKANEGKVLPANPLHIDVINPVESKPFMKSVLVACGADEGGYYLEPNTMKASMSFFDGFDSFVTEHEIPGSTYYQKYKQVEYLIVNGRIHKRASNMGVVQWESSLLPQDGQYSYRVAPFIINGIYPMYFDYENGRLLKHTPWNKGVLYQIEIGANGDEFFNPNNIGANMEMLAVGSAAGAAYWFVLRDPQTNSITLYKFIFKRTMLPTPPYIKMEFVSTAKIELDASIAPNISSAISFAANDKMQEVLMYATSDKVYALRLNTLTSSSTEMSEAVLVDLSAENKEITYMEFPTIQIPEPLVDNPDNTRDSQQIRLSVIDNTLANQKGGVMFYEVSTQGGAHANKLFERLGFCDEVIDIDEKYN
ncbi:PKD-like family lipoprotein [Carboxylicivirga taeanensis]|uniref:PKD-like family lipoprotein n=1 Tax=Carboxylicivirga taeanensis TaxID=1416875 RepID=UPI003F6E092F